MIRMPERSVTRFFIPLIDVLTLLFCVFLVMPLAQPGDGSADGPKSAAEVEREWSSKLASERKRSADALNQLEKKLDQTRQEKVDILKKGLWVRNFEVDPQGKIYYYDPERVEITSATQAQNLVKRDRREQGEKQLYYLILGLARSRYPNSEMEVRLETDWFKGAAVAYGLRGERAGEK